MKLNQILIVPASVMALLLAGCDEEKYPLMFSHYLHVTENEMECADCHGEAGEASFDAVTHETCAVCHAPGKSADLSVVHGIE